jgi:predicted sulfurtransferase
MTRLLPQLLIMGVVALIFSADAPGQSTDDLDKAPRISMAEFKKLLAEDKIFVIDVRGYSTYLLGHVPGARSFPLDELGLKIDELKAVKKPIVAYCA